MRPILCVLLLALPCAALASPQNADLHPGVSPASLWEQPEFPGGDTPEAARLDQTVTPTFLQLTATATGMLDFRDVAPAKNSGNDLGAAFDNVVRTLMAQQNTSRIDDSGSTGEITLLPEPASFSVLSVGLLGLAVIGLRRA